MLVLPLVAIRASDPPSLAAQFEAVLNEPPYRHAHWGLLFVDLVSGEPIFEFNADKLFVPASTTKLFSVAAALDAFGANHRFETPVRRQGDVSNGELRGDLVLVASGDLTMGGRTDPEGRIAYRDSDHTYANGSSKSQWTDPDPLAGLNALAEQIAKSGIRRITGDVFVDDRLFDSSESSGSGPRRVSPILVNDNVIDLLISPTTAGAAASLRSRPESRTYHVDALVQTVESDKPTKVTIQSAGMGRVVVRGQIAANRRPLLRIYEVEDPASFARGLFVEALLRAGVAVEASPLAGNPTPLLPTRAVVAQLPTVATLLSPPFSESARLILKVSHNLHASTLPLLVAARTDKRTLAEGLRVQHAFLRRAGVDVETISFGGGAGGSRSDYVTPRATVQLLRHMAARPDAAVFHDALPILGVDGTLADVVSADSPARGKVFAKTGTLYWENVMNDAYLLTSKALAGYMTTSSGRKLAFAMFVNNAHLSDSEQTIREGRTLGRLCEIAFRTL